MPACEKCWRDSGGIPDDYYELIKARALEHCSPEEQAGECATKCASCQRVTAHQHCGICMACGYDNSQNGRHLSGHVVGKPPRYCYCNSTGPCDEYSAGEVCRSARRGAP